MPPRSDIDFHFRQHVNAMPDRHEGDRPMRILIMGDFSGRGHRGLVAERDEFAKRPLVGVDVDNFDQVFARYAPTLDLSLPRGEGDSMLVDFQDPGDFHPARLFERLDLFQYWREMRQRLLNPTTFQEAAAQLRQASVKPSAESDRPDAEETSAGSESEREMLSRILGRTSHAPTEVPNEGRREGVELSSLIREIVQPHIVPSPPPDQQALIRSVDLTISDEMRRLLHDASFQALESIWRGVGRLIAELELGEELQLYLLDVTRDELQHDFSTAADAASAGVYRRVVDQEVNVEGGQPWSLIVGLYSFGHEAEDCSLLSDLGRLASQACGPFIAAASPRLLACDSLAKTPDPMDWKSTGDEAVARWQALRQSPVAPWLGLVLPRVLMRLPYGQQTDEVDLFGFEEMSTSRDHEEYLWGNPALSCALLIGKSFLKRGWSMQPGDDLEIGDLPAHTYESDGEIKLQACAEIHLTDRAADTIMGYGLMPLMSYKNRNAVRLLRFQSLADPPHPLAGLWLRSQ